MSRLIRISRDLMKNNLQHAFKNNTWYQTKSRCLSIAATLQHYGPSVLGADQVKKMYEQSLSDPETFWGEHARSKLNWIKDFEQVSNSDMNTGKHEWFLNGKINVSENCLDRHVARDPDATALIWEKDEPNTHVKVSYKELLEKTCQVANVLKRKGVQKGDTVCIYMPVSPIAVACMLACTRIGAVHSVVFAGFSAEALSARINDGGSKIVITADEGLRGSKRISLKNTVDKALENCSVDNVLVYQRTGADVHMQHGRDLYLEEEMSSESIECVPEPMDSEDPLFILYTSGSTGKPKGVQHSQAGYLLYAMMTHKYVFKYEVGDIYACVADIGWITGHSYVVYGPLANGATSVLFESVPTYPDPGRYWEMVERLKVNQFYGAPTAIRLLLKFGNEFVEKYDRDTLKVLGTVGEPINEEAWHWYYDIVGQKKCPISDTWWQTETGGIVISPVPEQDVVPPKPACPMFPFFGVKPILLDEEGKELHGNDVSGLLCLGSSLPGMARTIHGDQERFLDVYYRPYPGYYFTGDGARRDAEGHYHITGRVDDVINVKGVRLGTAEVEDVMDNHDAVAETAVVGYPHEIKGQGVYAYVTLKEGISESEEDIKKELQAMVKSSIGSFAVPEMIQIAPGLPKTRSGKIMRRILRCVAANKPEDVGDISTLADDSVVEEIIANHEKLLQKMKK
eukprot:TCONS_00001613-protein